MGGNIGEEEATKEKRTQQEEVMRKGNEVISEQEGEEMAKEKLKLWKRSGGQSRREEEGEQNCFHT